MKHKNIKETKNVMFWFLKKDISKVKNTLFKWILQNISENKRFQRTPKFIMSDFYEMDFMKWIVILINIDEMYKILESLLANRFWSRDKGSVGWSKFVSFFVCLSLPFIDRRFHIKVLGDVLKKLWAVEHHCVVYYVSI